MARGFDILLLSGCRAPLRLVLQIGGIPETLTGGKPITMGLSAGLFMIGLPTETRPNVG